MIVFTIVEKIFKCAWFKVELIIQDTIIKA